MKKKIVLLVLCLVILSLTACTKKDSVLFKEDYEKLNGTTNKNNKEHRTVNINDDNPIVISNLSEIVAKVENNESFYVYFGSKLCPWCRSVIEKAMEIATLNGIEKVYYVDIWDDEGNELFRDVYSLGEDGKPELTKEGSSEYMKLLDSFGDILPDYTYTEDGTKHSYGEHRIYAPTFIYVSKGKATRLTTGISELQTDSRQALTEEMLKDEEKQFDDFFINVCDDAC